LRRRPRDFVALALELADSAVLFALVCESAFDRFVFLALAVAFFFATVADSDFAVPGDFDFFDATAVVFGPDRLETSLPLDAVDVPGSTLRLPPDFRVVLRIDIAAASRVAA